MAFRDVLLFAILFLAIGFTFFVGNYIGKTINTQLVTNPAINASAGRELASVNTAMDKFDYIFLGVYVGAFMAIIITSWFVAAYPVFMWIYFFILVFVVAITTIFSQLWTELTSSSVWGITLSNFPITNHILTNLPLHIAVMGLLGILVLFGKPFFTKDFG